MFYFIEYLQIINDKFLLIQNIYYLQIFIYFLMISRAAGGYYIPANSFFNTKKVIIFISMV